MRKKFKYIKEYFEYKSNILGMDLGSLASTQDEYYKIDLYDMEYIDGSESKVILKVKFTEINNNKFNGDGVFKYIHSDIPGFSDVIPMELNGILIDVFEENPEDVIYMLSQLYDQIKR